ncbi:uncharacterized protein LOC144504728 [Mustelus asterias]
MAAASYKTSHICIWIALRRLDLNDDDVTIVKGVYIGRGLDTATAKQVLFNSFGIEDTTLVLKLRNSQGSLVPMNGELYVNSEQSPYMLEVTKLFQHVVPKPRTDAMTVINKGLKNRLQSIMKRARLLEVVHFATMDLTVKIAAIERIEELVPEIKMKRQDNLNEVDIL